MSILEILLLFVVVGVCLWLIDRFIPMDPVIKQVMHAAVVIILVVWLLMRLFPHLANVRF